MHAPARVWPCAFARSAARSAPDATFFASSKAAMEERPPQLPARRRQPPELELSLRVLLSPHLLWSTGPVTTMQLQTQDKEYLWESFPGLAAHLLDKDSIRGLDIRVPFCSHRSRD
jgi:hypothetical protein